MRDYKRGEAVEQTLKHPVLHTVKTNPSVLAPVKYRATRDHDAVLAIAFQRCSSSYVRSQRHLHSSFRECGLVRTDISGNGTGGVYDAIRRERLQLYVPNPQTDRLREPQRYLLVGRAKIPARAANFRSQRNLRLQWQTAAMRQTTDNILDHSSAVVVRRFTNMCFVHL